MTDAARRVTVCSRKWDQSLHRRSVGVELGFDDHGCWLWMPVQDVELSDGRSYRSVPGLRLLQIGSCWSAFFCPAIPGRHPQQLYVDICTPVTRTGDLLEFIDLDLDVEQLDAGPVLILDEDEFRLNAERYDYPVDVRARAEQTCHAVFEAIVRQRAPFDGTHLRWSELGRRSVRSRGVT